MADSPSPSVRPSARPGYQPKKERAHSKADRLYSDDDAAAAAALSMTASATAAAGACVLRRRRSGNVQPARSQDDDRSVQRRRTDIRHSAESSVRPSVRPSVPRPRVSGGGVRTHLGAPPGTTCGGRRYAQVTLAHVASRESPEEGGGGREGRRDRWSGVEWSGWQSAKSVDHDAAAVDDDDDAGGGGGGVTQVADSAPGNGLSLSLSLSSPLSSFLSDLSTRK